MLGGHEARIEALEDGMKAANAKLDTILTKLNETRGGWKMLTLFGGSLVGIVEIIEAVKGLWIHKT